MWPADSSASGARPTCRWTRSRRRRGWPDPRSTSTSPTGTNSCVPASSACTPSSRRRSPSPGRKTRGLPTASSSSSRRCSPRIDDNPAFFRLALVTQGTPAQGAEAVGAELALISLDIARLIRDVYEDGVAAGDFRPMDPDLATNLIGQQLYGAIAVRAGEPFPEPGIRSQLRWSSSSSTDCRPERHRCATGLSATATGLEPRHRLAADRGISPRRQQERSRRSGRPTPGSPVRRGTARPPRRGRR